MRKIRDPRYLALVGTEQLPKEAFGLDFDSWLLAAWEGVSDEEIQAMIDNPTQEDWKPGKPESKSYPSPMDPAIRERLRRGRTRVLELRKQHGR